MLDRPLMIDAITAMAASGDLAEAQPLIDKLATADGLNGYINFMGPGAELVYTDPAHDLVGGAIAHVLVAAEIMGKDVHNFGGHDLVAELKGLIVTNGYQAGRVTDMGPDVPINNSTTTSQAYAVIALAGTGQDTHSAAKALMNQQCSEGYFQTYYSSDSATQTLQSCDDLKQYGGWPDRMTSAISLSALLAARASGATGLDDSIHRAAQWLESDQRKSGGWQEGLALDGTVKDTSVTGPSTASTGLATQALAGICDNKQALMKARDFIRTNQVTPDTPDPLAQSLGAIAPTSDSFADSTTHGVTGANLNAWLHSTAQASLGLSRVPMYDLVTRRASPVLASGCPLPEAIPPTPTANPTQTSPAPTVTVTATVTRTVTAKAADTAPTPPPLPPDTHFVVNVQTVPSSSAPGSHRTAFPPASLGSTASGTSASTATSAKGNMTLLPTPADPPPMNAGIPARLPWWRSPWALTAGLAVASVAGFALPLGKGPRP